MRRYEGFERERRDKKEEDKDGDETKEIAESREQTAEKGLKRRR